MEYWDNENDHSVIRRCPHQFDEQTNSEGETLCFFHFDDKNKDCERFTRLFLELFFSDGDNEFCGFIFPENFKFEELDESVRSIHSRTFFVKSKFYCEAKFQKYKFNEYVSFEGAQFIRRVDFENVFFNGDAYFGDTHFSEDVDFFKASFLKTAHFAHTRFKGNARFSEVSFHGKTYFNKGTLFEKCVRFYGIKVLSGGSIAFIEKNFSNDSKVIFINVSYENRDSITFDGVNLGKTRFLRTDLRWINFHEVYWTNREYGSIRHKKPCMVYDDTFQCGVFQNTLRWIIDKLMSRRSKIKNWIARGLEKLKNNKENYHYEVYRLYTQLRMNYEETGRYFEAGDFYIGEMEMRRKGNFESPAMCDKINLT
ncbi:MAG: pentapeptide repeat-containing protein [Deltaproteobacteria bacterium]|nr:pentapeptide repeat-containing protein [Candidatus Zymogenaceae bacterium]